MRPTSVYHPPFYPPIAQTTGLAAANPESRGVLQGREVVPTANYELLDRICRLCGQAYLNGLNPQNPK
jgi:hypothetical protein